MSTCTTRGRRGQSETTFATAFMENVEPLFHPPTSGLSKDHAADSDPDLIANQPIEQPRSVKNTEAIPPSLSLELTQDSAASADPDLVANQQVVPPRAGNQINWHLWTPIATSTKRNPIGPVKDPVVVLKPYVHRPPPTCRSTRRTAAKRTLPKGVEKTSRLRNNNGPSEPSKNVVPAEGTSPLCTSSVMLPLQPLIPPRRH
ncbi:hypothetical protein PCANC_19423 [Puccinia coronata f. sp. avenae]|uniref:Uncharacterized protein n=1 Tax=Puccinia coronata f. sp. avenae TaxID=200324 RepID=A0A2N5V147_9BASI|nr:hypothetical protein PCANC_19423 [Puccinia coronata f. sp. avenae]